MTETEEIKKERMVNVIEELCDQTFKSYILVGYTERNHSGIFIANGEMDDYIQILTQATKSILEIARDEGYESVTSDAINKAVQTAILEVSSRFANYA